MEQKPTPEHGHRIDRRIAVLSMNETKVNTKKGAKNKSPKKMILAKTEAGATPRLGRRTLAVGTCMDLASKQGAQGTR